MRTHLGAQSSRQAPQHGAAAGAAAGVPAHVHALAGQQRGAARSARGARADGRIGESDLHGDVLLCLSLGPCARLAVSRCVMHMSALQAPPDDSVCAASFATALPMLGSRA